MANDWLGNELSVGSIILYSSTSTLTGMNIGEILNISDYTIQIQLWRVSNDLLYKVRKQTLHSGTSAFKSITAYYGNIPERSV